MAQISVLKNVFCMLRRRGLNYISPQYLTSSSCGKRLSIALTLARYKSDDHNSVAFQQLPLQPKTIVKEKQRDDGNILQNLESDQPNEYTLPSQHKKEYEDLLLKKITNSDTLNEVFNIYQQHCDVMNDWHMLRTMRILSSMVSKGVAESWQLHEDEIFQDLCHRILKSSRNMEVQDLVSLLQYLCRLEVPAQSKLVQSILQLLRHSINDMDLRIIVHLEFLLRKLPLTPLSHGMRLAIPLILENSIAQEPIDTLTLKQLSQILALCVSGKVRNVGLILQEIYKRGSIRSGRVAVSFLWSLVEMYTQEGKQISLTKDEELTREVILKECLQVVARKLEMFQVNQIETTLHKISRAYENKDFYSYNEQFFNALAVYCIKKDIGFTRVAHIIRKLLKMNYVSEDLVDYVISLTIQNPEEIVHTPCTVPPIITAITASSTYDSHHDALKILLNHKSLSIDSERCLQIPSLSLALDLLSIGYYHHPLLEILTSEDFLSLYMEKYSRSNVTMKQLLQLHQILTILGKSHLRVPAEYLKDVRLLKRDQTLSSSDLISRLHQILEEPRLVLSGVLTDDDLYIDHLIIIDEEGKPVMVTESFPSQGNTRIDALNIPENTKRIAILDIKSTDTYGPTNLLKRFVRVDEQLLEASGFTVVPILQSRVNQLTVDEKNLYIKSLLESAGCV